LEKILEAEEIVYEITDHGNVDLDKIDLGEVELEKKRVKNLREKMAITLKLIDEDTEVFYSFKPRPKYEVLGGFKIAKSRGAEIDRLKVYNLYFRFKSHRLNGTSTAMMFREQPNKKEYILLLPDDTQQTYESERKFYINQANQLVFNMAMNSNEQSNLIENLNLLNRRERCAQSLQHEWGHILHYRCFDLLSESTKSKQIQWFYDEGYISLLDERYPGLGYHDDANYFLYMVKEAFAEDIRINLNFASKHGMFILPNAITFLRDFQYPDLLLDGVNLVKNMITNQYQGQTKSASETTSGEINRVSLGRNVVARNRTYPEYTQTVSPSLIKKFIGQFEEEKLQKKHVYN